MLHPRTREEDLPAPTAERDNVWQRRPARRRPYRPLSVRHEKTEEEMKSEWCAAHLARLLGVKNKAGETFKCRTSPSCPRQHASDLSQVSKADAVETFGFIKGFIGTAGGGLAKDSKKGTFKGE